MASVSELLMAAQAKQKPDPLAQVLTAGASGAINSYNNRFVDAYNRARAIAEQQKVKAEEERMIRNRQLRSEMDRNGKIAIKNNKDVALQFTETDSGVQKTMSIAPKQEAPRPKNMDEYLFNKFLGGEIDFQSYNKRKSEMSETPPKTMDELLFDQVRKGQIDFPTYNERKAEMLRMENMAKDPLKAPFEIQNQMKKFPEVTNFQEIYPNAKKMEDYLVASLSGDLEGKNSLDQALISTFGKINDPGSVVRESEYARTPEGIAFSNRFAGAFSKWKQGGAGLTDQDRVDLVIGAKIIANSIGEEYSKIRGSFSDTVDRYGVDRDAALGAFKEFEPLDINKVGDIQRFKSVEDADNANLPIGTRVIIKGKLGRIE